MLKHKHLILAFDCFNPPAKAAEAVSFLEDIIRLVDMNIAKADTMPSNPQGYRCDLLGNEGVTAVGILETSHTVIHTWDLAETGKIQFDLYSCKEFDVQQIINFCKDRFGIRNGSYIILNRESVLEIEEKGFLGNDGVVTHVYHPTFML
jgi:S-adenosylmethionine/arginine decarboxylase-like enzyme